MWAGLVRSAIQLCRERRFPRHGNPGVRQRHRGIRPHAGTDTAAEDRDSHHAVEAWGVSVEPIAECGMRNISVWVVPRTTFPLHSAFRTPHSAFRIQVSPNTI